MIRVEFEADTPQGLVTVIREFLAAADVALAGNNVAPKAAEPTTQAQAEQPATQEATPPRRRRGRKPIQQAAEDAEIVAPAQPDAAAPEQEAEEEPEIALPTEDETADAILGTDKPAAPAREVTIEQVREAANAYMQKNGVNATLQIVTRYGCRRVIDVPKDRWPELYRDFGGTFA